MESVRAPIGRRLARPQWWRQFQP
jgi:hypothetical protein